MSVVFDEDTKDSKPNTPPSSSVSSNSSSTSSLPVLEPSDKLLMPHNSKAKCNTPEMERKNPLNKFKTNVKTRTKDFIQKLSSEDKDMKKAAEENHKHKKLKNKKSLQEEIPDLEGRAKLWIGKDYVNFIVKDFSNLDLPFIDLVDRQTTPRMPWHDVGVIVMGAAARDVARHFIQRWNATKLEKARINPIYPYLMPKTYEGCEEFGDIFDVPNSKVTCQVSYIIFYFIFLDLSYRSPRLSFAKASTLSMPPIATCDGIQAWTNSFLLI